MSIKSNEKEEEIKDRYPSKEELNQESQNVPKTEKQSPKLVPNTLDQTTIHIKSNESPNHDLASKKTEKIQSPHHEEQLTELHMPVIEDKKLLAEIEKYKKVQEELKRIVEATEQILQKSELRSKKKNEPEEVKEPELMEKEKMTNEQSLKISTLKMTVEKKTKELESFYNFNAIKEKEDELKDLKRIHQELLNENSICDKNLKDSEELVESRSSGPSVNDPNMIVLKQKIAEYREKYKEMTHQRSEIEKEINTLHGQIISSKIILNNHQKKMESKEVKVEKKEGKSEQEELAELEKEWTELMKKNTDIVRENEDKLKLIEKSKKENLFANEKLETLIKEKEKEVRENNIKLKELKRLQRHNILKPMNLKTEGDTNLLDNTSKLVNKENVN